jgi:hypothetical protein
MSRYHHGVRLDRPRKTTIHVIQDNRSPTENRTESYAEIKSFVMKFPHFISLRSCTHAQCKCELCQVLKQGPRFSKEC